MEMSNKYLVNGSAVLKTEEAFLESVNATIKSETLQVWRFLEALGYDFWLNDSGLYMR